MRGSASPESPGSLPTVPPEEGRGRPSGQPDFLHAVVDEATPITPNLFEVACSCGALYVAHVRGPYRPMIQCRYCDCLADGELPTGISWETSGSYDPEGPDVQIEVANEPRSVVR